MKILNISAQKPSSTGSGVFLAELVKEFSANGHQQIVVAGVYEEDEIVFPKDVEFHPVYFNSEELPFPIVGMSDEMPYVSTRYCDMTDEMVAQFRDAFLKVLRPLIEEFKPDVILTHHLYLLTAIVRKYFPDQEVYGFCHNTDLRQMEKIDLERRDIAKYVRGLDKIFSLHEAQKNKIIEIYKVNPDKVEIIGMGYNGKVFFDRNEEKTDDIVRISFAGKISEKKGLISLMRCLPLMKADPEKVKFLLAGGAGNQREYDEIVELAKKSPYQVEFLGMLTHAELADVYNKSDIFVLPSFFEGLPLTVIEALACGTRVVMTKLPGIPEWMEANVSHADVKYIELPKMQNADEPVAESLPAFEQRLAQGLEECIRKNHTQKADTKNISWTKIAEKVIR